MAESVFRPASGPPLLEKRVGASIVRSGLHIGMRLNKARWSWPMGRATLYRDRLEIKALFFKPLVLYLNEIETIRSSFGRVIIKHNSEDIPDHVALHGFGLMSGLRETIRRNGLNVRISS